MKTPLAAREMSQLPVPSGEALDHSHALRQHIAREIGLAGGWISFARYMDLALYAPGLGYYSAGAHKFGQAGDFVTAPEISSLFGQCLARQIAQVLAESGGDVLELGPGSGKLACDVLRALDAFGKLPQRYLLLEVSADLRERQRQILDKLPAHLAARAHWLDTLPASFTGVVIVNEVLDVLPVHVIRFADGKVFERGVGAESSQEGSAFSWRDRPLDESALWDAAQRIAATSLGGTPPEDYTTEVRLGAPALVASLISLLQRGVLIVIDYGFRAAEYYHPGRNQGTLMCHYRHYAHADPFYLPGLQDITAHVDFTAAAEAGRGAGADVLGYATQGNFLIGCGITDILAANDPMKIAEYLPLANQAQRLMSPAEMGEFFKVLVLGKGVRIPLCGFGFARPLSL